MSFSWKAMTVYFVDHRFSRHIFRWQRSLWTNYRWYLWATRRECGIRFRNHFKFTQGNKGEEEGVKTKRNQTDLGDSLREDLNVVWTLLCYIKWDAHIITKAKNWFSKDIARKIWGERFFSRFITTVRDVMWEKFNRAWNDMEMTNNRRMACKFHVNFVYTHKKQ